MSARFFVCDHCGNLITTLHDAGVPMLCCGEKMPERKKPPESLWAALRGQVLCTGILHRYITVIQFRSGSGSQAEPSAAEVRAA